MLQKATVGFRKHSPQASPEKSKGAILAASSSSDALIAQANRIILRTEEEMIQSKIRALLIGTELEDVAKTASIVIHMQ